MTLLHPLPPRFRSQLSVQNLEDPSSDSNVSQIRPCKERRKFLKLVFVFPFGSFLISTTINLISQIPKSLTGRTIFLSRSPFYRTRIPDSASQISDGFIFKPRSPLTIPSSLDPNRRSKISKDLISGSLLKFALVDTITPPNAFDKSFTMG